jgi:hypothetical protein
MGAFVVFPDAFYETVTLSVGRLSLIQPLPPATSSGFKRSSKKSVIVENFALNHKYLRPTYIGKRLTRPSPWRFRL